MKRIVMLVSALALTALAVGIGRSSAPEADQQAISVHGYWTIEVLEADGTTASVHEFENALHQFGIETLPSLLAREVTVNLWGIEVAGSTTHPCNDGTGTPAPCFVVEGTATGPNVFEGLSVSRVGSDVSAHLALAGDMVAQNTTSITDVSTRLAVCEGTTCGGVTGAVRFTEKTLDSPIPVSEGQTVHVEVDISFS